MTWDDLFMNMVHLIAAKSRDPSTHVGAVIVAPDHEVISVGYNGFPRGVEYTKEERQERPIKYLFYCHAERNAIYNACRRGISTLNCIMYASGHVCCDCGRAVIQSGIKEVVVDSRFENYTQEGRKDWNKEAEYTKQMFKEAGIILRYWNGELIEPHMFVAGKEIR